MAIIKFSKVKNITQASDYVLQTSKTTPDLISSFECDPFNMKESFNEFYKKRKQFLNKETKNKARMIIQSFDPNLEISAQQVHEIGKAFAERYLEGNHQFLVVTHIDNDHLHNHIIFNEVNMDNYKMYNTKKENMIDRAREIQNELDKENNIEPAKWNNKSKINNREKDTTQREFISRAKGISYKQKLENDIDKAILKANSYQDFLNTMKQEYDVKEGKYLSFKNSSMKQAIRSKSLGIHYSEESIKHRINHKDFKIEKPIYILKNRWIDKEEQKFKENKGLERWGTLQNINYYFELNEVMIKQDLTKDQVIKYQKELDDFYKTANKEIRNIDYKIDEAEKLSSALNEYSSYYDFVKEYKDSPNKEEFKRDNFKKFKEYDQCKRNIYILRKKYNIKSFAEFEDWKNTMLKERNSMYQQYNQQMKNRQREHSL